MRVLFDAYWWHRGPIANRTVMREMFFAWQRSFPEDELLLAVRNAHARHVRAPQGARLVRTHLSPQALANFVELPLQAHFRGIDLTVAHNFSPAMTRSAVFVHDLMFEDHPEWFTPKELLYFRWMGRLTRFANLVATSSQTEAERIRRLHPNISSIKAIGLAPSRDLLAAESIAPPAMATTDGHFLTVGRLNERKNLRTIIDGALRSKAVTPKRPLVIVGSSEYSGLPPSLTMATDDAVATGRVKFLGHIPDTELRWLYERATALIFLSLDEGYGLPVAEAGLFGTPVIASDIAVMHEVAPPGTTFVPVNAPDELAAAMTKQARGRVVARVASERESLSAKWDQIIRELRKTALANGEPRDYAS